MSLIEAKNIRKQYNSLQVLKGVDFTMQDSSIVSIVGKSGAGKSTLLHILGTLDQADSGDIIINGRDVSTLKGKELSTFRNQEIGFIFQFHNLLPEFTAMENICIPAYVTKKTESEIHKRANDLLELLNISARKHHKPAELSGGEQQRVAVARALINSPSIIFADEPSGNLDSQNAEELHNLFVHLKKEMKQSFVIVTHNKELAALSDVSYEMKDGILLQ